MEPLYEAPALGLDDVAVIDEIRQIRADLASVLRPEALGRDASSDGPGAGDSGIEQHREILRQRRGRGRGG